MSLRSLLVVFALLCHTSLAVAAEGGTIAFVVGVQHYDEPDLDKLQFTAKDAADVFRQLEAITNLDLSRSRLLIAAKDASETADSAVPPYLRRQQTLTASDIQTEFREFLQKIRSNDRVVFYLGGHGTDQANRHLLFLPSDFSRRRPIQYLRYDDLLRDIKATIDDANLSNVSVVFFANMCGAGTAAGAMSVDDDPDAEFVRRWLEDNALGFQRFAFFPATARQRNTHEDTGLGRSIFAHHLIAGLSGAAADDVNEITADSLFAYLNRNIADELPRHPDAFDGSIVIGTSHESEAMAAYLLGTSLLAIAADHEEPLLDELAYAQLRRVPQLSHRLGGLARVRAGQALAERGRVGHALEQLGLAMQNPLLPPAARGLAQDLLEIHGTGPRYPTLGSYAEHLQQGGAFYSLVISGTAAPLSREGDLWETVFSRLPGHRRSFPLSVDPASHIGSQAPLSPAEDVLDRWRKELQVAENAAQPLPHLVIVYEGSAGLGEGGVLSPISQARFASLAKSWPGFVVVIYTGPFAGLLVNHGIGSDRTDVALFVAGTEENAMTFSGGPGGFGTSELMSSAFSMGVEDPASWEPVMGFVDRMWQDEGTSWSLKRNGWVVGKPTWVPAWSGVSELASLEKEAKSQLRPLQRWPVLLAAGCADQTLAQCRKDVEKRFYDVRQHGGADVAEDEDLFRTLKTATNADFAGRSAEAERTYTDFLMEVDAIKPARPAGHPVLRSASDVANSQLARVAELVRERREGAGGKSDRRIILLRVAVEDYRSPFVVDLSHTATDLEIWADALRQRFGDTLDVKPMLKDPGSARSILSYLSRYASDAGDDDLVVFLYSGRGYEQQGKRYLTAANMLSRLGPFGEPVITPKKSNGLVDLSQIADAFEGEWLFAVYDAQFTPPLHGGERFDSLFDKHLDSVRPLPAQDSIGSSAGGSASLQGSLASTSMRSSPPRLLSSEGVPARQVHVFWEGRLTEAQYPDEACALRDVAGPEASPDTRDPVEPTPHSPLTTALLHALYERAPSTYRTVAERASRDRCLLGNGAEGQLVFQGDLDIPVFATGKAAEHIVYFLGDQERLDLNVQTGLEMAGLAEEISRADIDRLTRAALQVLAAKQQETLPGRLRQQRPRGYGNLLADALETLSRLDGSALVQKYAVLDGVILDLKTEALRLAGRGEEARLALLEALPKAVARHPVLLERLVNLTEQAMRTKPADVVRQVEDRLGLLDPDGVAWTPALRQRWQTLAETLEGVREPYRIRIGARPGN